MPFSFFFVQRLLLTFMALCLGFAATKRRLAVVGLTANMCVNKHGDLSALPSYAAYLPPPEIGRA